MQPKTALPTQPVPFHPRRLVNMTSDCGGLFFPIIRFDQCVWLPRAVSQAPLWNVPKMVNFISIEDDLTDYDIMKAG